MRDAYTAAGLTRPGVLWHSLRHTYASILAAGGIREDVVAVLMGHKRQGTTSLYTHLFADAFEGVEQALAAALDVNQTSTECGVSTGHSAKAPDRRSGESDALAGAFTP